MLYVFKEGRYVIWVITDIVILPHGDFRTNLDHSIINYINQKLKKF